MKKKLLIFIILLVLSLAVSGCSDKEEQATTTQTDESVKDIENTETEAGSAAAYCPAGTTTLMYDANTHLYIEMEVMGMEVVDGIEMCYLFYESDKPDEEGFNRLEIYRDENDDNYIWTYYDADGNVIYEVKYMYGKGVFTGQVPVTA
ncbi:MAG: hypothetical protein R2741_01055 [Methanolobus sp.]